MFRLLSMTFAGKFRGTEEQAHHLHESPAAITIPLIVLAVLAIVAGFIGIPELFLRGGHKLEQFLSPVFAQSSALLGKHEIAHNTEYILMGTTVVLILVFSAIAWRKYSRSANEVTEATGAGKLLENKWYVEELYNAVIVQPLRLLSLFFNKVIEKSFIDGLVNGIGRGVNYSSRQVRLLQSGQVGSYILMMVIGIILIFLIQMFVN